MKLEARHPLAGDEGLVRAKSAPRQQGRTGRKIEGIAMPMQRREFRREMA